jgi:hypothetical protein
VGSAIPHHNLFICVKIIENAIGNKWRGVFDANDSASKANYPVAITIDCTVGDCWRRVLTIDTTA